MSELTVKDTEARKRLLSLFDEGTFTELDAFAKSANGEIEIVAGYGSVNGVYAYAFSQDITVDGGAISVAQCAKIKKIYELAKKTGCPVIGIYDSNGMKLREGFEALNAYGEILKASTSVSGVVLQISVVAGACLGTSALMANMADVVIAVKDADFYVTAPSKVKAEESFAQGTVDILADDVNGAIASVKNLVSVLPSNNLEAAPMFDFEEKLSYGADASASAKEIINAVADENSVVEIKAGYAENAVTAFAQIAGSTVGVIAFDGENVCPSCAYKAEAFIKLCDAFNISIVTFVHAKGLVKEKENQMLVAATKLTSAYATATCPKISVITGKAIGAAYIALAGKGANADLVFAWDTAIVSPLEVDAAVAFLYNDRLAAGENRAALEKEYEQELASPFTAAACGAIDDIFVPAETRTKLINALSFLDSKRETTIPRKHSVK
ncbi:MAG: carboxyl transferase [Eubacterium sp.]|nr:carboxyl transferase [Eubacterium sp.]